MPKIIFVPGKNPKPPPEVHRPLLWRCLLEGVRHAAPEIAGKLTRHEQDFGLIAWNHDYYGQYRDAALDRPWIDELLARPGPSAADRRAARSWHVLKTRCVYSMCDAFPSLFRFIENPAMKSTIAETRRYFENHEGVADRVRGLLTAQIRQAFAANEKILLVGHSLGSVISYDALWSLTHEQHAGCGVDLFLTLGSPLGVRFVQSRLRGHDRSGPDRYPHGINRWTNVASVGDLTALDARLRDDFREMLELGLIREIHDFERRIYNFFHDANGLNVHRAYGYLVNPVVGRIIGSWWSEN